MLSNISGTGQQFLSSLSHIQNSVNEAQLQISSGLKVAKPSDAPDEISAILQLHANIQANLQTTANLNSVQTEVTTGDQSLSSVTSLLDQVQVLASQGVGITQTAANRANLASQVQSLTHQIVGLGQTTFEGRFIFGGTSDQSPSYQYNTTTQTIVRLDVSSSTRQAADSSGATFPVGLSANQIFDVRDASDQPANGNVYAALTAVSNALLANDPTALQTAASSIRDASAYVNQQQTFYGQTENRITEALSQANQANLSYQQDLSNRQDADVTSAILELQENSTNLQAALAAYAKVPHTSLFSVLSQ
jgi:flagellar hook-associated protein 3 FlgL